MAKLRLKQQAETFVAQSKVEVEDCIREAGELQRLLAQAELAYAEQQAQIKEAHLAACRPISERLSQLSNAVQVWCEAHRDEITQGGKTKTVVFTTGEVSWRTAPPSVRIQKAEVVLATLKRLGLSRFIRLKEEPNKEAMLAEVDIAKAVAGISISQGESFELKPWDADPAATVTA